MKKEIVVNFSVAEAKRLLDLALVGEDVALEPDHRSTYGGSAGIAAAQRAMDKLKQALFIAEEGVTKVPEQLSPNTPGVSRWNPNSPKPRTW